MADLTTNHFQLKKNIPDLKAGDRVRVHQKISEGGKERVQVFEGLVIKTQGGKGINGSFTVRRITLGVGVEKNYPLHLPTIVKIEKLKSAKVRRAKLYYVRGLVGKKARRLKREKKESEIWEDVVVEEETQSEEIEKTDKAESEESEADASKGSDESKDKKNEDKSKEENSDKDKKSQEKDTQKPKGEDKPENKDSK